MTTRPRLTDRHLQLLEQNVAKATGPGAKLLVSAAELGSLLDEVRANRGPSGFSVQINQATTCGATVVDGKRPMFRCALPRDHAGEHSPRSK